MKKQKIFLPLILVLSLLFSACSGVSAGISQPAPAQTATLESLPDYDGAPFVEYPFVQRGGFCSRIL